MKLPLKLLSFLLFFGALILLFFSLSAEAIDYSAIPTSNGDDVATLGGGGFLGAGDTTMVAGTHSMPLMLGEQCDDPMGTNGGTLSCVTYGLPFSEDMWAATWHISRYRMKNEVSR